MCRMMSVSLGISALLCAAALPAQSVPTVTLTRPLAELSEPFSDVAAVRELSDGRVIVVDKRDLVVDVIDFTSGSVWQIGRSGDGPGEYRWPVRLYPLPGDSSVVVDNAGGRMLLIGPDAKPGGLLNRYGLPGPDTGGTFSRVYPRMIDRMGHWYGEAQPVYFPPGGGEGQLIDSAAIVRINRATGREDTVAFRHLLPDPTRRYVGRGGVVYAPRMTPFIAWDFWLVAPDGRVAFVFPDPYHVDFASPTRQITKGPEIQYAKIKVTDALKQWYRDERAKPVMGMSYVRGGGSSLGLIKPPPFQEPDDWPDLLPPYLGSPGQFDGTGMLWIERAGQPDAAPSFDLIDGSGHLARRVTLPKHTKLVGFGNGTLYAVRLDEDDLEYLQRYRLPTTGHP